MIRDGHEHLRFTGREAQGLFKTTFGGGIVVTQSVKASQSEEDASIGWCETTGILQRFNTFLKILAVPRRFRSLKHTVQ